MGLEPTQSSFADYCINQFCHGVIIYNILYYYNHSDKAE